MSETDSCSDFEQFSGMPAAEFVLHRESMLLLDRLVSADIETAVCEWDVTENSEFMSAGLGVPAYVGVEYMAQCIAVHAGVRARLRGQSPPLGFLLGTRHFKTSMPYFGVGTGYRATCTELIRDSNGMCSYEGNILLHGKSIAGCRLAVLEKERGKSLNA